MKTNKKLNNSVVEPSSPEIEKKISLNHSHQVDLTSQKVSTKDSTMQKSSALLSPILVTSEPTSHSAMNNYPKSEPKKE